MREEGGAGHTENKRAREEIEDGIRQGIGILSAFKDAFDITIQEALEHRDVPTDRAKQVMKDAIKKAQAAASNAWKGCEGVNRSELDVLRKWLLALEERVLGHHMLDKEPEGD